MSEIGPKEMQLRLLKEARWKHRRVDAPSTAQLREKVAAVKPKAGKSGKKKGAKR